MLQIPVMNLQCMLMTPHYQVQLIQELVRAMKSSDAVDSVNAIVSNLITLSVDGVNGIDHVMIITGLNSNHRLTDLLLGKYAFNRANFESLNRFI
jgi:hypothetical protein